MKNCVSNILLVSVLIAFMPSCEKIDMDEEAAVATTEASNVIIHVTEMQSGWNNASSRNVVNISEVCSKLCFAVYQNGQRVKYQNQKAGDSGYGTYSLQLAPGSYQLLIIGHSGKANPSTTDPAKIQFTNPGSSGGTGFTDTFYHYGAFEVSSEGASLGISMQRASAMFQLVTDDVKPEAVKKFQFYYEGGSGALNVLTGCGCVKSKQAVMIDVDDAMTGKPLTFEMFTFPREDSNELEFTVTAFDANNTALYTKVFEKVKMQRNCITRYTGSFFVKEDAGGEESGNNNDTAPVGIQAKDIMVETAWQEVFDFTY